MSPQEMQRLIDNLSRMYAVIVGLAVVEGLKRLLNVVPIGGAKTGVAPRPRWEFWPEALATFFTIVAFFHGMNRYMDATYLPSGGRPLDRHAMYVLMFDFTMFFAESCILLATALSLCSEELATFKMLIVLFVWDGIWCTLQCLFHGGPNTTNWLIADFAAAGALVGLRLWKGPSDARKARIMCAVCLAKVVVDYWLGWSLYFPYAPRSG